MKCVKDWTSPACSLDVGFFAVVSVAFGWLGAFYYRIPMSDVGIACAIVFSGEPGGIQLVAECAGQGK